MRNSKFVGLFSMAVLAAPSYAQQAAAPDDAIQSITITATKREATLQDVPISVSVTSQATIEQAHITDLIDLQSVVPSLQVTQFNAVGQTNFIIRGFGNGSGNDGIESSVGVFVDGVYRSRTSSALDDLPEVSRIEVLRGPQSTLFGKNVSSGAINIVTVKPQFTFAGKAEIGIGSDSLKQVKASITGPFSETMAYRLSVSGTQRDGYLNNETTGTGVNDRDRSSVRADFLWKPDNALSVRVIADYNRIAEVCCGAVSLLNGPATQFVGAAAPNGLGAKVSNPANKFDDTIVFNTDPVNRLAGKGISAQADWKTGGMTVTSITAYRNQTNQSYQDVDFTGADLANKNQANKISTFTQELRLASSKHSALDWMVGAFYQKEKLDTGTDISYGTQLRSFANGLSGAVPAALLGALPASLRTALTGKTNMYALEFLQSLVTPSIVPGSTYFKPGQGILDHYKMNQESFSLFGNADWEAAENLTVSAGVAFMSDRKKASSDVTLNDPFSSLNLQNVPQFRAIGLPPALYGALGGLQFYYGNSPLHAPVNFPNASESGTLSGSKLTGALRVNYDMGPSSIYASYSTGWKAGAFNLSSDSRPSDANGIGRTAAPENVVLYEAGWKTAMRKGFLTVAVFDQAIKGFQSNDYTGTGYNLTNAGKESTRGVEIDGAYTPEKWVSLTASATYLDAKYNSFLQAGCVSYDTVRCAVNPATGLMPASRDLSGERPANIPRLSLSTSATFSREFGEGYSGYVRAEYDYSSPTQLSATAPPSIATWGKRSINASVGMSSKPGQFDIMLWVRNLADTRTIMAAFPTVAQAGSYSAFPNQPRMLGATLRKRF
ncbi:TonB-dependent receptor [Massilia psychrophila]|uniref:TonB-dependent receptor n=1 Tax=Massilia psychrophila TaxID=1603353 RepID=A0A2G8SYL2_9BURK|nr:TonB-dependent receptor [Massilia psychrophila]PIL38887.1 TonB-dependent receptor [Massilia psychrophila]GGE91922.1 TonB-dependent receptor [Massilia psychrophila]